jgi:hypothetical protein
MQYFEIKETNTLAKLPRQDIESYLIKYFQYQKDNNRTKNSMNLVMFAVNHFCLMNDILVNIKKIFKFKTSLQKQDTDFAYTHADILKLTNVMPLQLRNLKKIDNHNLYKFTIYEGEKEQYITYCTPETASLIDEYLDYRRRSGEKLTEDSFLIREEFKINGLEIWSK